MIRQSCRSRFGDLIRAVGLNDRRRFLADLWTARGWETTAEGSVAVTRRGDRTEWLAVVSRSWFRSPPTVLAEATIVVALGDPERTQHVTLDDAWVLSVDEFYDLVRCGPSAGRGDDLVADHLGVRLDDLPADDRSVGARGADEAGGAVVSPLSHRLSPLPVTPLVFVALLFTTVVVTAGSGGVSVLGEALGGHGSSTPTSAATTPEPTSMPEPRAAVPGVITAGVENATRLAAAHRRAAANQSYRWTLDYRELIAGDETGREVEVVRVEALYVYVSEVRRTGRLRAFSRPTASGDSYADGTTHYARRPAEPGGVAARVLDPDVCDGPGRQVSRVARYLDWYLLTDETSVMRVESTMNETTESGTTLYQVRGFGTDFPRSRDYRVEAVVEEGGLVRSMRVAYETRDGPGAEVWSVYDAVGGTAVTRPAWLDRVGGSTGGRIVVPTNVSG